MDGGQDEWPGDGSCIKEHKHNRTAHSAGERRSVWDDTLVFDMAGFMRDGSYRDKVCTPLRE